MKEEEINRTLTEFKNALMENLPKNNKQIESLWLSLMEIFQELVFNDKKKYIGYSAPKKGRTVKKFDNINMICKTSIELSKKNSFDNLISALAHMDARLVEIELYAHTARKRITLIMNNLEKKLPKT